MRQLAFWTIISFCMISCNKEPMDPNSDIPFKKACVSHTKLPSAQYTTADFTPAFVSDENTCDLLPIDNNNYWIYRDSIFNGSGAVLSVRIDSVYYKRSHITSTDGLVFWSKGSFDSSASTMQFNGGYYSTGNEVFQSISGMLPNKLNTSKVYFVPTSDSFVEPDYLITDYQFGPRVTRKNRTVSSEAGRFTNALEVDFKNAGARLLHFTEYFVPQIGIVKSERRNYGFVPVAGNVLRTLVKRELIRYKVD